MPHRHNAYRRHHIGKMKFRVMNWQEYEAGLRRSGSMPLFYGAGQWLEEKHGVKSRGWRKLRLAVDAELMLVCIMTADDRRKLHSRLT